MSKSTYLLIALVLGALFAGANSVFARSDFGKKLELLLDQTGKPKSLTIVYTYDHTLGWYIGAVSKLTEKDIVGLPEKLNVKIVNSKTGKVYYSQNGVTRKILLYTNIILNDEASAREFLPEQKDSTIVISGSDNRPLYYLSLRELCENYPANVTDLSRQDKPACEVDPKDLGNKQAMCEQQKEKLLNYVKLGFATCASAKDIYAKLGCGELDCK